MLCFEPKKNGRHQGSTSRPRAQRTDVHYSRVWRPLGYPGAPTYFKFTISKDVLTGKLTNLMTLEHLKDWPKKHFMGCRHSSVDSSAPTILPPWVRFPSTPTMLLSFIVKFVLYLSCENNEINKKRPGLAHFLEKGSRLNLWFHASFYFLKWALTQPLFLLLSVFTNSKDYCKEMW